MMRVKGHGICACALERLVLTSLFKFARRRYRRSETSECRQANGTTVSDSIATVVGPYLLEETLIEAFNGREKVSYLRYECTKKEL